MRKISLRNSNYRHRYDRRLPFQPHLQVPQKVRPQIRKKAVGEGKSAPVVVAGMLKVSSAWGMAAGRKYSRGMTSQIIRALGEESSTLQFRGLGSSWSIGASFCKGCNPSLPSSLFGRTQPRLMSQPAQECARRDCKVSHRKQLGRDWMQGQWRPGCGRPRDRCGGFVSCFCRPRISCAVLGLSSSFMLPT